MTSYQDSLGQAVSYGEPDSQYWGLQDRLMTCTASFTLDASQE